MVGENNFITNPVISSQALLGLKSRNGKDFPFRILNINLAIVYSLSFDHKESNFVKTSSTGAAGLGSGGGGEESCGGGADLGGGKAGGSKGRLGGVGGVGGMGGMGGVGGVGGMGGVGSAGSMGGKGGGGAMVLQALWARQCL
jgi:hypothetical protein